MSRTRVLFIANAYPRWTGTDAAGLTLITRMAERGYDVTVLQTWTNSLEHRLRAIGNIKLLRAFSEWMNFRHMRVGWIKLFMEHMSDVCVLNKGFYLMRNEWVDVAARLSSKRYVAVEHHPADPPDTAGFHGKSWMKAQAAFALHYAALHEVLTNSRSVRDRLRKWYRLPSSKGVVIPFGIDTAVNAYDEIGRQRLRAKLGISNDTFLFGSVGRLAPEKGLDRLLPVFARVAATRPERKMTLVLAGEGCEAARLKTDAAVLGIADKTILPGWLEEADRIPFLSALDCFILPSRDEGQGLALLEAMACERPVIGTACGGVEDILTTPQVGWITGNDEEIGGFEAAMREVLNACPNVRRQMGERARQHVEKNFSVDIQLDKQVDALLGRYA